jgi:hypothetical protein
MKWPNHADYAEAIQHPGLCFQRPELQAGTVATTPLGLPRALSGNFASVYEITSGGVSHAVRCFVRQVTNQQDRYAALARHLAKCELSCMVPFEFIERGINVQDRWFPIVKMDWVRGVPLHDYVEQQLATPEQLAWLAADWRALVAELKRHRIAHGDLQHGNVLVTPEGELRLVDYDGMYVPLFARERSPELGHANFQHPRRSAEFYDERLDHFPELLIYLSLRALAAEPGLWNEFFNGDNLIVTAVDLRVPESSLLWPRLLESPDEDVRRLTVLLTYYLRKPPVEVPGLEAILNEQLSKVVVPAKLEFSPADQPLDALDPSEAFSSTCQGTRAAQPVDPGAPSATAFPQRPRLVEVFGWSALLMALLALLPPLRSLAGIAAVGLGLLTWAMPGRTWQTARMVAALAVLAGLFHLTVAYKVQATARNQHIEPALASNGQIAEPASPPPESNPAPAAGQPPLVASIDASLRATASVQAISQPLLDSKEPPPLAAVTRRWLPHTEKVTALALSADGRQLFSTAADRSLVVWNLARDESEFLRTHLAEPLIAVTALTNSGIVATLDAMHHLQWWSLDGRVPLKSVSLDPDSLVSPVISPDGHVIALGGKDRRQVTLHFDTVPRTSQALAGLSSWAKLARFSPDSRVLAVACHDDTITLRDTRTGAGLGTLNFPDANLLEVLFSTDGQRLLAVGEAGNIRVWNTANGELVGETALTMTRPVATWLPGRRADNLLIAADGKVVLLRLADGLIEEGVIDSENPVTALATLPYGSGFITGHASGEVAIWGFKSSSVTDEMTLARP